jgi:Ca2+-binding EF-hand superfamily protein
MSPFQALLYKYIADNPYFDMLVGVVLMVQVATVVMETNTRAAGDEPSTPLTLAAWGFLVFYSLEVSARIYVYRRRFFWSKSNCLDVGVVGTDFVVEAFANQIGDVPSLCMLRLVRVFRIARVLRAARSFAAFRELYMMIHGFFSAMKAIFWATVLLAFMLVLWGIIAVEIIHPLNMQVAETGIHEGCPRCLRAFESVEQSALTFVQQIVAGDSWGQVTIPIIEQYPFTVIYFTMVLISIDLGLMNLILSVIVGKAQQAHDADRQFQMHQRQEEFKQAKRDLLNICQTIDEDDSGELTLQEIEDGFDHNPEFYERMRTMDVHKEDLANLFKILDEDGSGAVNYNEFVEQLHKIKTMDAQVMLVFIRSSIKDIKEQICQEMHMFREDMKRHEVFATKNVSNQSQILSVLREVHGVTVPPGSGAAQATRPGDNAAVGCDRRPGTDSQQAKRDPRQEKAVMPVAAVAVPSLSTDTEAIANPTLWPPLPESRKLPPVLDEEEMERQLQWLREQIGNMDLSLERMMHKAPGRQARDSAGRDLPERVAAVGAANNQRFSSGDRAAAFTPVERQRGPTAMPRGESHQQDCAMRGACCGRVCGGGAGRTTIDPRAGPEPAFS